MSTAGLEILNLHAQGGMAEVYRARAVDEGGRVWYYAVKRMLPELLKEPEMMRMFLEEQRVAACLVHENIVRVYDVASSGGDGGGADGEDTFIVMEFLEGRDLSEVIEAAEKKHRTLPIWFCIHVARDVLRALTYATTQARDKSGRVLGLIHRDISPHNIFVCRDGQVKLTDFGVAKVETAEVRTKAGIIKGKFGYMSPEQLSARQLDFRSDLYNVGILLYESLTCKRLFFGETATQFIAAMMTNEIPALDKRLLVPPELDLLMRKALAKKLDERPQSPAAFEQQLAQIAAKYNLVAQRGHVAQEMADLFPELALSSPTDELQLPPVTEPEQRAKQRSRVSAVGAAKPLPPPEPTPIDLDVEPTNVAPPTHAQQVAQAHAKSEMQAAQKPHRAPTNAKRLTMMTVAPAALISSSESELPVFTETRDKYEGRVAPTPVSLSAGSSARSSPSAAMPKPPTKRAPAPVAAPPPSDDELVPTLMEPRPSLDELGLEPAPIDLLAHDDQVEGARTEPTRTPAFMADRPSTTAPGRDKHARQMIPDDDDDDRYDPDGPTTEVASPNLSAFGRVKVSTPDAKPPAPPQSPRRVSTGSRRVISLTDDDEKKRRR